MAAILEPAYSRSLINSWFTSVGIAILAKTPVFKPV